VLLTKAGESKKNKAEGRRKGGWMSQTILLEVATEFNNLVNVSSSEGRMIQEKNVQ
jgi:hypothetical protein